MDQHYNPFQNADLLIPDEFMAEVRDLTQTRVAADGSPSAPENSPFPRYVDMWFAALLLGARRGSPLEPSAKWHSFVTGQVLQGDRDRIAMLELVAIAHSGDAFVVRDPKTVIGLANGFAAAGMPELLEMLRQPNMKPLDGFAEALRTISWDAGVE